MAIRCGHTGAFLAALLLAASLGHAGEGKGKGKGGEPGIANNDGIDFILEHAQDLKLDSDQKAKLTELGAKIGTQKEKLKADPEIRELFKAMNEAKQGGDQEAMRADRKKLREAMEKKSG